MAHVLHACPPPYPDARRTANGRRSDYGSTHEMIMMPCDKKNSSGTLLSGGFDRSPSARCTLPASPRLSPASPALSSSEQYWSIGKPGVWEEQ